MPELPEVETVRRRLAPHLTGRVLADVAILDHRLTDPEPPEAVAARLAGGRIEALGRRGKYLLIELDDGAALTVHLRIARSLSPSSSQLDRLRHKKSRSTPWWKPRAQVDPPYAGTRQVQRGRQLRPQDETIRAAFTQTSGRFVLRSGQSDERPGASEPRARERHLPERTVAPAV